MEAARRVLPRRLWPVDRFITIGAALLLTLAAGDVIVISMQRDASIAAYEAAVENLARAMSVQTAHALGRTDQILREVVAAARDFGAERAGASALEPAAAMTDLGSFAVMDAQGRVVSVSPGQEAKATGASASRLFRALRDSASTVPMVEADEGGGFKLGRRLLDRGGRFAGIVVATLTTSPLREFYAIALPPKRKLRLMSESGALLIQYPPSTAPIAVAPRSDRLAVKDGACVAYFGPDPFDDQPVVAAVCRFKDLPFTILTTASADEALAYWRQERIWPVVGGLAAGALVVWLLHVFAHQVRRLEISERSLAVEKLEAEAAHRQLDVALSNISQGVCFFDAGRRLIVANSRFRELYHLPEALAVPGAQLSDIVEAICEHGGLSYLHRERFAASFELVARAHTSHASVFELGDGRAIAVQSRALRDGGWVGTHEDITERRRAEDKISFLARHDVLTGLVNRSVMMEQFDKLADSAHSHGLFAVLFMDLDRFKAVNDTLGHHVGDALLKLVADRLRRTAPAQSTIVRFGGDEFVILATGVSGREEIAVLAQNLIETVSAPYKIAEHEVEIGVSVGVDIAGDGPPSADALLKNADIALYRSKSQGRGTFRFFEPQTEATPSSERGAERQPSPSVRGRG